MIELSDIKQTLWHQTAPVIQKLKTYQGYSEAYVVIVGAGYTGLSCALHMAKLGHKVIVLEAKEPGWGGSGRNAGQWLPGWAGRTPQSVEDQFGIEQGNRLNKFNLQASQHLPEFIKAHGIKADLKKSGVIVVAHTKQKIAELNTMHEGWKKLGADTVLIKKNHLGQYLNTQRYFGGLLYRDAGSLNPQAYINGLVQAALSAGVEIYASSPARDAKLKNNCWHVSTPSGLVVANNIAICTNAHTGNLFTGLRNSFYRLRIAMLASEIMSDHGQSFMPATIPFADTNALSLFGGMCDAEGRFVASILPRHSDTASTHTIAKSFDGKFRSVFKGQEPPRWQHSWHGDLCVVPDRIPKLYKLGQNAIAAMGYSGAGIALGTAMGKELSLALNGNKSEATNVPIVDVKSVSFARSLPFLHRHIIAPMARSFDRYY